MRNEDHNLYRIWLSMRNRCTNPNNKQFNNYGRRGISVCDRWNDFWAFVEDVGPKPSAKHSIDRIDNDGNYEPSNVKWSTPREQASNRRSNLYLTYQGQTNTASEWSKITGIPYETIRKRKNDGLPVEDCLAPGVRRPRLLTYQGREMTLSEWARELGINIKTIYRRLERGCSIDEVLSTDHKENTRWISLNGETRSITSWSKLLGICPKTIRKRLNAGFSPEEILKKAPGNIKCRQ